MMTPVPMSEKPDRSARRRTPFQKHDADALVVVSVLTGRDVIGTLTEADLLRLSPGLKRPAST